MAKNVILKKALVNKATMVAADTAQRNKALDDLLAADQTNISAIRTAIINNKGFWGTFPELSETATNKFYMDNDTLLTADGPPALTALRQATAEQRVSSGLKDIADDVLINILTHNSDECRAYIASRPELGMLNNAHGWKNDEVPDPSIQPPPPPSNKTTELLSDAAINRIKAQTKDLLLSRIITQADNKGFLVQLRTANDKSSLERAANQLGYPNFLNAQLTFPLSATVKKAIDQRLNGLKQVAGREVFEAYAASLLSQAILAQKGLLEGPNQSFKSRLLPQVSMGLDKSDINWAKGILGARYLQEFLATSKADVSTGLKATNEEELIAQLKAMPDVGDHKYVEHAVKGNLHALKKAMLQSHIVNQVNDVGILKKLDKAANTNELRAALVEAGVNPADWIQESDLSQVQQWARSHLFKYHLSLISQVGAEPHVQLRNVFAELPVEKQRHLINDPFHDYHLLNANDVEALEVHLGKGIPGLDKVVEENEKLAGFKQIQNAAAAKILVNFRPEIQLNPNRIKAINRELAVVASAGTDFTNPAQYKALIDKIRPQCAPVDTGNFYDAFGLKKDGAGFKSDVSIRDGVIKQNTHNQKIMHAYNFLSDLDANKKLLGVFLTLDKSAELDPDTIINKFKSAKTYQEFIESVTPPNSALRVQLYSQLSSTVFYDLKMELNNRKILSRSSRAFNEGINAANEELKSGQKNREITTKSMKHFKFIEGIEPYHLYNPAFRGAARTQMVEMKAHYQSLSDECDLIIDQLRHQLRQQQSMLDNFKKIQGKIDPSIAQVDRAKLTELNQKLNNELKAIQSDLQFYEKVQQKLSGDKGILTALNDAADNKKAYVFLAQGVTRQFVTRNAVDGLAYKSTAPKVNTSVQTNQPDDIHQFLLKDHRTPAGQIEAVDVVKTDYLPDGVTKAHEATGRYTVDRSPPESSPISLKGDKKNPGGRVEIHQFPKQTIPPAAPGSPEDQRLKQAKIEFALTAAADTIALLDKAPTKENPLYLSGSDPEEMRYLYTALIVLGEKNPNMKFGADAIKLNRYGQNDFKPADEKSSFLGINTGYKKDSLYQQFKTASQPEVDRKVKAVNEMSSEKMGLFAQRSKVDPQAMKAAAELKKNNMTFREDVNKRKEAEGPEIKRSTGLNNT